MIQFHVQTFGQIGNRCGNLQAHGKDHHVEVFNLQRTGIIHIADAEFACVEHFVYGVDP